MVARKILWLMWMSLLADREEPCLASFRWPGRLVAGRCCVCGGGGLGNPRHF